jgi:hypothetical protein
MLLPYSLTHSLTPHITVLLEKLTSSQPVKKFPTCYGTRRFITTFTSASHLSLSWASSIQSTPPHPTFWRSALILSSHLHLGLPSGLFPSGYPTKTLYTPLPSPIRATYPANFIILDFITRTIVGEQYRSLNMLVTIHSFNTHVTYITTLLKTKFLNKQRNGLPEDGITNTETCGR